MKRILERLRAWRRGSAPGGPGSPGWSTEEGLRASYRQNLDECGYSTEDDRVVHHLFHLMLYWSRLIGIMRLSSTGAGGVGETEEGWLRTSLWTMVRIGTEMSDADVSDFAARTGEAELGTAWAEYASDLASIGVRGADAVARARAAHARFARVDEIRRDLALLHRYEIHRTRLVSGSPP